MRFWLPRLLLAAILPLILFAACSKASGARPDNNKVWGLTTQDEPAQRARNPEAKPAEAGRGGEDIEALSGEPDRNISSQPSISAAAREREEEEGAFSFAVISDLNGSYGSKEYAEDVHQSVRWLAEEQRPELVISTGDMVAGQRRGLDYRGMWASFHAAVTNPLGAADIPLAVTPGNHDASAGAAFLEERLTFVEEWRRHKPEVEFVDERFYPLHYAFKMRGVLFISLDATMVGPLDAAQMRWLREVLSANPDARARVVYGHIPLYPVTKGREQEILDDPELEHLLGEFEVDLMLSGHHHGYFPGRRGDLRMVAMACLGSGPRPLVGSDTVSPKSLVMVRVDKDGELSVEAYDPRTHERVQRDTLPEFLNDEPQRIWRDDISGEEMLDEMRSTKFEG